MTIINKQVVGGAAEGLLYSLNAVCELLVSVLWKLYIGSGAVLLPQILQKGQYLENIG